MAAGPGFPKSFENSDRADSHLIFSEKNGTFIHEKSLYLSLKVKLLLGKALPHKPFTTYLLSIVLVMSLAFSSVPLHVLQDSESIDWVDSECNGEESEDESEKSETDPIAKELFKTLPHNPHSNLRSKKTGLAWFSWHTRNTSLYLQKTPVPPPKSVV
jgi:hypothetical protein